MTAPSLAALDAELAAIPGTVSVWCGRIGGPPAYTRHPDATHYAASTMKVAVLAALYRAAEAGTLDLDAQVPVRNRFPSALAGAPPVRCRPGYDSDDQVWKRLGGTATLRWLARRMIVVSGNLAANICLTAVGLDAVARVWRSVGARHSVVGRCIEDTRAAERGITNLVTAADLAALLSAIARADPALAGPGACAEMLDVLFAQERGEDLPTGLPPGTRVAHKNGWITGVRHGAALVFPPDADPYCLVCCTTTPLARHDSGEDEACRLLARVAAASWADRHTL
ncbi:MAG: serine hydrolase [Micromonosporaceae bacterium]